MDTFSKVLGWWISGGAKGQMFHVFFGNTFAYITEIQMVPELPAIKWPSQTGGGEGDQSQSWLQAKEF